MVRKIHQIIAGFRDGDAISNTALLMQSVFRSWGMKSEIYCLRNATSEQFIPQIKDLLTIRDDLTRDDIAILHLSIGTPANHIFAGLNCKKVIIYHNITPPDYFLDENTTAALKNGREDMCALTTCADINIAVSRFNASELECLNYKDVKVLPLPIDLSRFGSRSEGCNGLVDLHDGFYNILFVGRCAPNKKIENLLTAFYHLSKLEPRARLVHVGGRTGLETYYGYLLARAKTLGLQNVSFLDSVPQDVLNSCYASAHAFLCLSEHEGFCAPLIEAMLFDVPVLALNASAVPETLDGAGILFDNPPSYPYIAETLYEVLHNQNLRNGIISKQRKRIEAIRNRNLSKELEELLSSLL